MSSSSFVGVVAGGVFFKEFEHYSVVSFLSLTVTLTLTLTILCVATLLPQERFQREGAKCLIWNQHKLES